MKSFIISITLMLSTLGVCAQTQKSLKSPNGKLEFRVNTSNGIVYSVLHNEEILIEESPISITLNDGRVLGKYSKPTKFLTKTVNNTIEPIVYKRNKIKECYNEMSIHFKGNYSLIFRAYDDGVAYRWNTSFGKSFEVESEEATYNFGKDYSAYVPYVRGEYETIEQQYFNSFENLYDHVRLSEWNPQRLAFSPLVVEMDNGKKVAIVEADLFNYPGMFLHSPKGENSLRGQFAPIPKSVEYGGHNQLQGLVKSRESYIAKCEGQTVFPWRGIIISEDDKDLADSDFVYKLSRAADKTDYSWIRPGKVAWDWWNDWNLYNVDFESGINNRTYKYYIDFAASKGIEYVILDEGWAVNLKADLMQVVPEIDIKELVDYANNKSVGLILWAGYYAFNRDMENVCRHYSEMGIKGFKIDFMDRDDQLMVNFHEQAAQIASKYKLLINFHGTYKPTGLQRTYPNVINFEGVHGLEQMKWSDVAVDQVTYDVTMPFIRMLAGPVDYTQGAMRNATKENYRAINTEAMSQGTRCRQLAQYIVFDSPLNMLCDSPSNYIQEKECTEFIASVPTVWDNSISLNGEISKYIAIARQSGTEWYVGAMTNWDERSLNLDLSFLGQGDFVGEVFKDGVNANRVAKDYKREEIIIPTNRQLAIKMASGGGYVIRIHKK